MNEHQESNSNESFFSTAQQQQLKKKITLTSSELIELTYNEEKFNSKLDELNKEACILLEQDKYIQAAVYLDEAERILEYAAGCGKTIERTLITTILNNQACLLQRTSEFEQSANYLQAIIYNINQFVECSSPLQLHVNLSNPQSLEYAQMATFLQRKLLLSIYYLRFCALNSHIKNNQGALKSAKTALTMLKELCKEQYLLQQFMDKSTVSSTKNIDSTSPITEIQTYKSKNILKDLSNIKQITHLEVHQEKAFLNKCMQSIAQYQRRLQANSQSNISTGVFQNYSIGNLMQASPQQINSQPISVEFVKEQLSQNGKLFKVIYLSMAHFTVATELRYISASKYSLDQQQRKSSLQFRQSKVYHLLSLILLTRYLNSKSVFFQHSLSSFRNHYGIDLIQQNDYGYFNQEGQNDFSVIISEGSSRSSKGELSQLEEAYTNEDNNKSVEYHQPETVKNNELAYNMFGQDHNAPKIAQTLMKQIHNEKIDTKIKIKQLKSKSKSKCKQITTSFSRVLESNKNINMVTSKNKENKSKSKMVLSKGKQTIKSRRKQLKTQNDEEIKKGIYYGFTEKSRSKSKKAILQRRDSKKGIITKSGLVFQNKKLKNEVKVDQQYGVRSAGTFGDSHKHKFKNVRHSQGQGLDQQNIYLNKNTSPRNMPVDPVKMKKLKSPTRNSKNQTSKRKSMSKERYFH